MRGGPACFVAGSTACPALPQHRRRTVFPGGWYLLLSSALWRHLVLIVRCSPFDSRPCPLPVRPQAASHRVRLSQFKPGLKAAGIDLQIQSLLDDTYPAQLRGSPAFAAGLLSAYGRRIQALCHVDGFDLAVVHCELLPLLPGWLERQFLKVRLFLTATTRFISNTDKADCVGFSPCWVANAIA